MELDNNSSNLDQDEEDLVQTVPVIHFIEFNKGKNGIKRSVVWEHFLRAEDGNFAKCKQCSAIIRTREKSTTALFGHLRGKHKLDLRNGKGTPDVNNSNSNNNSKNPTPTTKRTPVKRKITHDDDDDFDDEDEGEGSGSAGTSRQTPRPLQKQKVFLTPKIEWEEKEDDDGEVDEGNDRDDDDGVEDRNDEMHFNNNGAGAYGRRNYQAQDYNGEITLASLQDKSKSELKDIIFHLQYKRQEAEIECQKVKTKLAHIQLAHTQNKLKSIARVQGGRIITNNHVNRPAPASVRAQRARRNIMGEDDDDDEDS